MSGRGILDADLHTVWGWITAGSRWWISELQFLVPQRLRQWQSARKILADYQPDTGEFLTRLDPEAPYPQRLGPVTIILPVDLCLTRTIERPAMSPRDLTSMIQLEGSRIMPMAASDMILANRIIARTEPKGRMQIEVAAMPRRVAEALSEALARLDQPCLGILTGTPEPLSSGPISVPPIDFLPAMQNAGLTRDRSRAALPWWIAVGVLFTANLGLLIWRDTAAVDTLAAAVAEQQPAVNAVRRIKAQIARADSFAAATVASRKSNEPLAMLSRVAANLPEGAWVQRYTWQGESLRLSGFRPAQADIAGGLRRAGLSVQRYSDASSGAQNALGQPFEVTLRIAKP
jgi:hypothetical protein